MKKSIIIVIIHLFIICPLYSKPIWNRVQIKDSLEVITIYGDSKGNVYFTTYNKIYKTTDNGKSWDTLYMKGWDQYTAFHINKSDHLFVGLNVGPAYNCWNCGILRSTDGGISWEHFDKGLKMGDSLIHPIFTIRNDSLNGMYLMTFDGQIFSSPDNGESWIESDFSTDVFGTFEIDKKMLFFGVTAGGDSFGRVLLNLKNPEYFPYFLNEMRFWSIRAILVSSSGYIYACDLEYVVKSTDKGMTWKALPLNLDPYINPLDIVETRNHELIITESMHGICYTSDDFKTYELINDGIEKNDIELISQLYISETGYIYASSDWNLYVTQKSIYTSEESKPEIKTNKIDILYSRNGNIEVNYEIAEASPITLEIYDLLGSKIAEYNEGYKISCKYNKNISGFNHPIGTYLILLRTMNKVIIRKFINSY